MEKKPTAAIFGLWWSSNYGSQMTYYALNRLVASMGYDVFMIDRPGFAPDNPLFFTHGRRFAKEHYVIEPPCDFKDMEKLNEKADTFIMGSDQIWNFGICYKYHLGFYLGFVHDEKKKLAYAASFGHDGFFAPEDEIEKAKKCLSRFDAISVREESAVGIMNHTFGLKAARVLDPIFAADPAVFEPVLAAAKGAKPDGAYLAAYILDPDEKKREALLYLSKTLNLPLVIMLDGERNEEHNFEEKRQLMALEGVCEDLQVEDWLYLIKNCTYFVTDSCHGASFAILYEKPFVCFKNEARGAVRMDSLAHVFQLEDRFLSDPLLVLNEPEFLKPHDLRRTRKILEKERRFSKAWLKKALDMPVRPKKNNQYRERPNMPSLAKRMMRKAVRILKKIWRRLKEKRRKL